MLLMIGFGFPALSLHAQNEEVVLTEATKHCLSCHGEQYYSFENYFTDASETKRMNPFLRIDSTAYRTGVHGVFSCDDCHSPDYATYPHNAELKLEFKYTCQDCHGGDPTYAHLGFDEIETAALESVHAERMGDAFKCEMCHDPHTNKLVASSQQYNIEEIVSFGNNMCLSCHGDQVKYHVYTSNEQPEIIETHSWLPNQSLHFKNVRCIECHTATNDTMMVAHKILSKDLAVKNCAECHSQDNMLQAKLYKYLSKESREEDGLKAAFKNEAYVIGAHRSRFLNVASIAIFGITLFFIAIHIVVRIVKRK